MLRHSIPLGTTLLMSWRGEVRYFCLLQCFVVSFLSPLASTLPFSRTGAVRAHLDSLTHRHNPFPLRNSLQRVRFSLSRIANSSCSVCGHPTQDTSHLILHCPATDSLRCSLYGDSLSLCDFWSRLWEATWLLGLHGRPPAMALTLRRDRVTTTASRCTAGSQANYTCTKICDTSIA